VNAPTAGSPAYFRARRPRRSRPGAKILRVDEDGGETVAARIDLEPVDWRRFEYAAALEHVSIATLMQHAALL
jgi:hypothetical protein